MIVLTSIVVIFRNRLEFIMQPLSLLYITTFLSLVIVNMRILLPKSDSYNSFFMGFAFSQMHRMIDYRVIKFQIVVIFSIVFTVLRFTLLKAPDTSLLLVIVFLEFFPIILSYKTEEADRLLFDSLHKSKAQLFKFKDFLTLHLPNQMAVLSKDFSAQYFMNNSFKRTFRSKDMEQLKKSFVGLIFEREEVEKKKNLLSHLGYREDPGNPLSLAKFLELLSCQSELIKNRMIEFQVSKIKTSRAERREPGSGSGPSSISEDDEKSQKHCHSTEGGGGLKKKNLTVNTGKSTKGSLFSRKANTSSNAINRLDSLGAQLVNSNNEEEADLNDEFDLSPEEKQRKRSLDNTKKVYKVRIMSLPWDGDDALALLLDDITHERTILELKLAAKNKDLMIAMISHELKTPLNGMLGFIDIAKKIIRQSDSSPKVSEYSSLFAYLEACRSSSILLLNLINSVLDFSQIRNNQFKLFPGRISVPDFLNKIKGLFDHFCQIKNLSLSLEISPEVTETIISDRNRLGQVLITLLANAFKFTFSGGVTISVTLENRNPYQLRFSIQDTGIGIKPESQERLFKLFEYTEDQRERRANTRGIGMGLTISNAVAQQLSHSENKGIQIVSQVGKGSTFSFVIESLDEEISEENPDEADFGSPRLDHLAEKMDSASIMDKMATYTDLKREKNLLSISTKPQISSQPYKVESSSPKSPEKMVEKPWCLVVDDNPFNLMVARHIMEDMGYHIKVAMHGQEAIDKVKEHHKDEGEFKVILMDCQMPIMDGYEASRILTKMMKEGKVKECPIIAVTANIKNEEHDRLCKESGICAHVGKPFRVEDLESIFREVERKKKKKAGVVGSGGIQIVKPEFK